ncbi:MAG: hypothetical protein OQK79_04070 [Rhodanobacter sp.]|nr:hypothetical protein [Rhodanobacter sp.]
MPDLILKHVDSQLVQRIEALARQRSCTVNEVMLEALRNGLGISATQRFRESRRDDEALSVLPGQWAADERGAFEEAMQALAQTSPTQLAPETIRAGGSGTGGAK